MCAFCRAQFMCACVHERATWAQRTGLQHHDYGPVAFLDQSGSPTTIIRLALPAMNSGDIGDHSLNDLNPEPSHQQRLPPSSSSPFVQPPPFGPSSSGSPVGAASSSSTGSSRPAPPPLSPTRPTNGYSGGNSLGPTSLRSPRIPSSPSSSSLLSPTKGAPPMLLPPHLSPRKLSRSNSTPRPARQRAGGGLSQDLGVADIDRDKYQASLEERARQKRWVEAFAVVRAPRLVSSRVLFPGH